MKKTMMITLSALACQVMAASEITVEKPYFRWLWGGFGFQNSEANLTALMPDDFLNERVLKTFAELSPTFGRVYTGFAEQSKEQLDRFADYYDKTFRKAGTTLYAVPCGMPAIREGDDPRAYAEKVAKNLEYLVKVRDCRKLRFYCLSNELMVGDSWDWFSRSGKMDLYKAYNEALYDAFRAHGLDIKILATDKAVTTKPDQVFESLDWARTNMNDVVGAYCSHWYVYGRRTDELCLWKEYNAYFDKLVQLALKTQKRFILGEYGFHPSFGKRGVMQDDVSYHLRQPETAAESVLCKCELALAAFANGAFAAVNWSFVDYPDPFVIEDGHTPEERLAYEAGKCGYKLDHKYNKCGLFRWGSVDRDYSSYHELYAMGHLVRLFRKGATVLPCKTEDDMLRPAAAFNRDRSVTIAVINRGDAREVTVDCGGWQPRTDGRPSLHQPLRRYVYDSANVPFNAFNDLQPHAETIVAAGDRFTVTLPAKSMTFFTTDYVDRVPAKVEGVRVAAARGAPETGGCGGNVCGTSSFRLVWTATKDPDHRYYRVYRDGKQIASTVATSLAVGSAKGTYSVKSVDKWLNVGD